VVIQENNVVETFENSLHGNPCSGHHFLCQ